MSGYSFCPSLRDLDEMFSDIFGSKVSRTCRDDVSSIERRVRRRSTVYRSRIASRQRSSSFRVSTKNTESIRMDKRGRYTDVCIDIFLYEWCSVYTFIFSRFLCMVWNRLVTISLNYFCVCRVPCDRISLKCWNLSSSPPSLPFPLIEHLAILSYFLRLQLLFPMEILNFYIESGYSRNVYRENSDSIRRKPHVVVLSRLVPCLRLADVCEYDHRYRIYGDHGSSFSFER